MYCIHQYDANKNVFKCCLKVFSGDSCITQITRKDFKMDGPEQTRLVAQYNQESEELLSAVGQRTHRELKIVQL